MTQPRAITLNALSLYAVALVLAAAFAAQFMLHELPCPLCLLQRILFATLAVGPVEADPGQAPGQRLPVLDFVLDLGRLDLRRCRGYQEPADERVEQPRGRL